MPGDPIVWTFAAGITQIICPLGLALGIFSRIAAFGLLNTMLFAIYFHLFDTGLEGFPFAVVEGHNYAFELSAIYAAISLYFVCAGPGRLSAFRSWTFMAVGFRPVAKFCTAAKTKLVAATVVSLR